jgi:ATP-binding cassette, subfamily B, bacterial
MFRLVRTAAHGLHELRMRVFDHLHAVPTLTVARERRGALVARVTADIETVTQFIEWGGIGMLVGASQLTVVAVLMLAFDPLLAAVVLASRRLRGVAARRAARARAPLRPVRGHVASSLAAAGEAISGLPTIRAYGIEARTARASATCSRRSSAPSRAPACSARPVLDLRAVRGAHDHHARSVVGIARRTRPASPRALAAFLLLVTLFVAPVQLLVEILDQAQSAAAGLRRVLDVLDTPRVHEPSAPASPRPDRSRSRSRDLTYAYPEGPPVLRGVDVVVPAGQRVAIVGRTGSGKSTFVKVVTRLQQPPPGRCGSAGSRSRTSRRPSCAAASRSSRRTRSCSTRASLDNVRYGDPTRMTRASCGVRRARPRRLAGVAARRTGDASGRAREPAVGGRAAARRARARVAACSRTCSCSTRRRARSTRSSTCGCVGRSSA